MFTRYLGIGVRSSGSFIRTLEPRAQPLFRTFASEAGALPESDSAAAAAAVLDAPRTKSLLKSLPREERRTVEVSSKNMRVSPQKLNVLAKLVRRMNVLDALDNLRFSNKRVSAEFLELLNGGVQKAKREFDLEPHELVLAEAYVGKGLTKKTMDIKGRGKTGIERTRRSHLTLVVRESRKTSERRVEVATSES